MTSAEVGVVTGVLYATWAPAKGKPSSQEKEAMLAAVQQAFKARGFPSTYTRKQLDKSIENRINNYKRRVPIIAKDATAGTSPANKTIKRKKATSSRKKTTRAAKRPAKHCEAEDIDWDQVDGILTDANIALLPAGELESDLGLQPVELFDWHRVGNLDAIDSFEQAVADATSLLAPTTNTAGGA